MPHDPELVAEGALAIARRVYEAMLERLPVELRL